MYRPTMPTRASNSGAVGAMIMLFAGIKILCQRQHAADARDLLARLALRG